MRLRRTSGLALLALLTTHPAWGYRPYDSTDADVAEEDEIEVELGWEHAVVDNERVKGVRAVLNFGLGGDREIVVEGGWLRTKPDFGTTSSSFQDVGALLKQVHRRGSLQGESGLSVASECGVLFPTRNEDAGVGGECLLVASHELSALAIHINAGLAYETDHRWSRSVGLIIEGAGDLRLKPGIELVHERSEGSSSEVFALAGMSWTVTDACALDIAHRWDLRNSGLHEWRLGLTWTH